MGFIGFRVAGAAGFLHVDELLDVAWEAPWSVVMILGLYP